jgi:hypothetical protein
MFPISQLLKSPLLLLLLLLLWTTTTMITWHWQLQHWPMRHYPQPLPPPPLPPPRLPFMGRSDPPNRSTAIWKAGHGRAC